VGRQGRGSAARTGVSSARRRRRSSRGCRRSCSSTTSGRRRRPRPAPGGRNLDSARSRHRCTTAPRTGTTPTGTERRLVRRRAATAGRYIPSATRCHRHSSGPAWERRTPRCSRHMSPGGFDRGRGRTASCTASYCRRTGRRCVVVISIRPLAYRRYAAFCQKAREQPVAAHHDRDAPDLCAAPRAAQWSAPTTARAPRGSARRSRPRFGARPYCAAGNELPRVAQKDSETTGHRPTRDVQDAGDLLLVESIDVIKPRDDPDLGAGAANQPPHEVSIDQARLGGSCLFNQVRSAQRERTTQANE
jgi:hypothetical protein